MVFTDDDLKRLKKNWLEMDEFTFNALIARLEAAEWSQELLRVHYEAGMFDDWDEEDIAMIVQALKAWHRVAGK